ncbi:MAG: tRNA (guanosine(18)-2'-O)-methyltransferase TrmH [Granulosicoccaceae bacterium]
MTPERLAKLRATLDRRQPDLTVLADYVHKPHNIAAIIRTCDAVGIGNVQLAMGDRDQRRFKTASGTALGSDRWVNVSLKEDIASSVKALQADGVQVVAAHLDSRAVSYREVDYTTPTALLLGAEKDGVSESIAKLVDQPIIIPMMGMVQSFNVSVAAAIILSEAQHQRDQAGLYGHRRLDEETYQRTLFCWAHPKVADYCDRHQVAYPSMDEDGNLDPEFLARYRQ